MRIEGTEGQGHRFLFMPGEFYLIRIPGLHFFKMIFYHPNPVGVEP